MVSIPHRMMSTPHRPHKSLQVLDFMNPFALASFAFSLPKCRLSVFQSFDASERVNHRHPQKGDPT